MEYRKLPHGTENEAFGVLGLGMGGIQKSSDAEIEAVVKKAIKHGINYFDLCAGAANVYAPVGRALKGLREKLFMQIHFGAVYNKAGEYGWSRNFKEIKKTVEWEFETLGIDYADMGLLHCVDEDGDYNNLVAAGVLDYMKDLKKQGLIRHIGFSSHTPSVANRILDTGFCDIMMFSINPAYDFEKSDECGSGSESERAELFRRCQRDGVGISVMKPFCAGKLLEKEASPFHEALTKYQCIQYAIDRPGVLCVLPGVRGMEDLDALLGFSNATPEEKDYAAIKGFTASAITGSCVYCNHCQPCPVGIDIGLVNKYYDLALAGDKMAAKHYEKLIVKADKCISCGHCDERCPFGAVQSQRMKEIKAYFEQQGFADNRQNFQ